MIYQVIDFAREFIKDKNFDKVLDVGSRDVGIEGNLRNLFSVSNSVSPDSFGRCNEYIGFDLEDGKNVDVVGDAEKLLDFYPEETFDCVLCVETLEHVKNPILIVENMKRVLKKDGWLFITTPGIGHPEHNWPSDYYRYFENTYKDVFFKDFKNVVTKTEIWDSPGIENPNTRYPHAILGYGQKP